MSTADEVVRIAQGEVGKPYATHRDCSGFTAWAFRQVGITLPEGSVAQWGVGTDVSGPDGRRAAFLHPGDLVFWDTFGPSPGHVALAINPSQVVHALNPERGIVVSAIYAEMGGPMVGVRRVIQETGAPDPPKDPGVPGDGGAMSFTEDDRKLLHAIAESLRVPIPTTVTTPPPRALVFGRVPEPRNYTPKFIAPGINQAWDDLGPRKSRGIVLHRMLGTLDGTDQYFRNEARFKALTDFGIGKGKVYRWTQPGKNVAPWASGPADGVRGDARLFLDRYKSEGVSVFNRDCRSIEIAGQYDDPVSAEDYSRLVELVAYIADSFKIPWHVWPKNLDGVHCLLGHSEITAQKPCPGEVVYGLVKPLIGDVQVRLKSFQEGA